jgi:hypothetical protein
VRDDVETKDHIVCRVKPYLIVLNNSVAAVQQPNKLDDSFQELTRGTAGWRKNYDFEAAR